MRMTSCIVKTNPKRKPNMLIPDQAANLKLAIASLVDECAVVATLYCNPHASAQAIEVAEALLIVNKKRLDKLIDSMTLKRNDEGKIV